MIKKGLENKVVTKSGFPYGNLARAVDVRTREIRPLKRWFYTGSKLISSEVAGAPGYFAAAGA